MFDHKIKAKPLARSRERPPDTVDDTLKYSTLHRQPVVPSAISLVRRPFDAVFRPAAIVETPPAYDAGSLFRRIRITVLLGLFFIGNLLVYTLPLSLAGIGTVETATTAPAAFADLVGGVIADPDSLWRLGLRIAFNSLFLLTAALITLISLHSGVVLTGSSKGFLRSLRIITFSTALYLATIFTIVWYTTISGSVVVADDILVWIQGEFVYLIIDWMGSDLELSTGRPDPVQGGRLTPQGTLALVGLGVSVAYYAYVLYIGGRKAHELSRLGALWVVSFVAVSPAAYVIGSVLVAEIGIAVPQVLLA